MKKIMSFVFIFVLAFSLIGCNKTDEEKVQLAKDNLKISFKVNGNSLSNVTGDLKLVAKQNGVDVTWSSDNKNVISNDGKVVLPNDVTTVELTATLKLNDVQTTKTFILTVKSKSEAGETDKDISDWFN